MAHEVLFAGVSAMLRAPPGGFSGLWRAALLAACALVSGCDQHEPFSPPDHRAFELGLAVTGERLAAVWHGGPEGDAIWMRFADNAGRPAGSPVKLTDGKRLAYEPDLKSFVGDWLLAWYEKDPADDSLVALVARFNAGGERIWLRELASSGHNGRNPVVRVAGDTALLAWLESTAENEAAIWTARIDADGNFREAPSRRAPASRNTWNLNAALDDAGTFHVVYDARIDSRAKELHLLSISATQVTRTALTADDGFESTYPDLALSRDRAALTWFDAREGVAQVHLFAGSIGDLVTAIDTRAQRVTRTPGPSIGAYLAWNGDRIGLVWCDSSTGQSDLYSQQFDPRGTPLAAARQLTDTQSHSSIPAIEPWQDGFAIAWNEYQPVPGSATGLHEVATSVARLRLVE